MMEKRENPKKWMATFVIITVVALLLAGVLTAVIDPYFLFHKPLPGISYLLDNERYQNYGIARSFDYNAVIVGTSMSENFKPSEFDALFGVTSVKLPYSGGSHLEVRELLEFVFAHQENVKCVIRNIDLFRAFDDKEHRDYAADSYPLYLYDDNPLNDVRYLLNFEILVKGTLMDLVRTVIGKPSTTLDQYANWNDAYVFGPEGVQANYSRNKVEYTGNGGITEEEYERIRENIEENVLSLAKAHPEVTFYLYVSPYSIYFWDYVNEMGELERYLKAQEYILSLLLDQENVKLFGFYTEEQIVTDPYNYRDVAHHHEDVNSLILQWLHDGHDEITKENFQAYCDAVWKFYHEYDYDSLFEADGYTIKDPRK